MNRTNHKRSKMGMLPGDIPKVNKIELYEDGRTVLRYSKTTVSVQEGAGFKKTIRAKERARLKERARKEDL